MKIVFMMLRYTEIMQHKNLEIKFGGDLHEIDVDLLVESLVSYLLLRRKRPHILPRERKSISRLRLQKRGVLLFFLI